MLTLKMAEKEDLETVADLAKEIWHEHYDPLIGSEQVDYMLDRFQSVPAIENQIANDSYLYKLLTVDEQVVGYYGIQPQPPRMFLSKIYLLKEYRGKGLSRFMLNDILKESQDASRLYLTVNKGNVNSIAVYKKLGFEVVDMVKADIGNGFYMDDFIMEKSL